MKSEVLIDYNTLFYQSATLAMEVEGMGDDALIEECNHIMMNLRSEKMDRIFASYFHKGVLSSEQRKEAIAFYQLAYGEFVWEA